MSKILIYSQEDLDLMLELEKEKNEELQQENKQLKDELKSNPDTQITLQDDKGNKFMVIQTERIDMQVELKKQLEERTKMYQNAYDYSQKMEGKAIILETQQKEFIKYLEVEIKKTMDTMELLSDTGSCRIPYLKSKKIVLEKISQKYKKIIGDDK